MRANAPADRRPNRTEERAVSPVIGAVLLLAIGVLLVSVLQATAIPALNSQYEFEHNERVQTDLVTVGTALDRTVTQDASETVTVSLGLRYPPRLLFINPPPATGDLATSDPGTVTVRNARAAGETGDYWDGSARSFETRRLVYRPGYNEYGQAPETVVEPWVVYDRIDGRTNPQTESDLVDGRRISLVAIQGTYQQAAADDTGLTMRPTSAPPRVVTVENTTGPVTLTVPTGLRNDTWATLLEDELDPDGTAPDRYVTGFACAQAPPEPCGELTLTFEPGQYELALGAATLDSGTGQEPARYLTTTQADRTIPDTGTRTVTVEVRDRFNAPVAGTEVAFSTTDGTLDAATATTDENGRASVTFTPSSAGTATVTARADLDGDGTVAADEAADVPLEVFDTSGGGGGGGGGVGTGETSQWTMDDTTRTISQQGGVWTGVDGASSLTVSDARLTPVRPSDQQFDSDNEYLRTVLVFEAGDTKYLYEFTDSKDGVKRAAGGAWGDRKVNIYRKTGDTKYSVVGSAELSEPQLDALYQGRSVDLLDQRNYDSGRNAVVALRNFLRSSQDVDVYIADMDGRITVTLE